MLELWKLERPVVEERYFNNWTQHFLLLQTHTDDLSFEAMDNLWHIQNRRDWDKSTGMYGHAREIWQIFTAELWDIKRIFITSSGELVLLCNSTRCSKWHTKPNFNGIAWQFLVLLPSVCLLMLSVSQRSCQEHQTHRLQGIFTVLLYVHLQYLKYSSSHTPIPYVFLYQWNTKGECSRCLFIFSIPVA